MQQLITSLSGELNNKDMPIQSFLSITLRTEKLSGDLEKDINDPNTYLCMVNRDLTAEPDSGAV